MSFNPVLLPHPLGSCQRLVELYNSIPGTWRPDFRQFVSDYWMSLESDAESVEHPAYWTLRLRDKVTKTIQEFAEKLGESASREL